MHAVASAIRYQSIPIQRLRRPSDSDWDCCAIPALIPRKPQKSITSSTGPHHHHSALIFRREDCSPFLFLACISTCLADLQNNPLKSPQTLRCDIINCLILDPNPPHPTLFRLVTPPAGRHPILLSPLPILPLIIPLEYKNSRFKSSLSLLTPPPALPAWKTQAYPGL